MGKKHHSKRSHRSRDASRDRGAPRHHPGQSPYQTPLQSNSTTTTMSFAIPSHPTGIPPALPSPTLPLPENFNFPLPPSHDPPRQPRPVIIRQHGLYTYHSGAPQHQQHQPWGHAEYDKGDNNINEKAWPGPRRPKIKNKEEVIGHQGDPEKGILDIDTEALEGEDLKDPTPPNRQRKRTLKCVLILTLMILCFIIAPICIGVGISIAKRKQSEKNGGSSGGVEGAPTVPSAGAGNGLSYGDWFCGGCRCVRGEEALARCLAELEAGR